MPARYLFGPVTARDADHKLRGPRRSGACLAFGPGPGLDVPLAHTDTWDDLIRRLPDGWRPDFVVLDLHYTRVPPALWDAPVPVVGLAHDWSLLWSYLRLAAPRCDLVLTDGPGVDAFARQGITHARAANLYGLGHDFLDAAPPDGPRPLDVLFVGNLHPAVQRERLRWLGRVARLSARRRVAIRTAVFNDDYRRLLGSARIVFNRSIRSECNMRVFEAVWAGALLFQETSNAEVPRLLRDRQECVLYTDDNLEELLGHYLDHGDERRAIAEAARRRLNEFGFEPLWEQALAHVEAEWSVLCDRAERRRAEGRAGAEWGLLSAWEALGCRDPVEPSLLGELEAEAARDGSADLHNALGVVVTRSGGPQPALGHFDRACAADPRHLVAALNRIEALLAVPAVGSADDARAAAEACRLLPEAERLTDASDAWLDAPHAPAEFDDFRVEWERAAWAHAGDRAAEAEAKGGLIRWRLHLILGDLTGELAHHEQAARLRPELPVSQIALGCARARTGRLAEAVPPLRRALRDNPFDRAAAQALFDALRLSGQREEAEALAADRRLLAAAAPQAVPAEPWFAAPPARVLRLETITADELARRFGAPDTARALCGFTPPHDTHAVLTLLAHARPQRILEIGTAAGHMTANLTEWTPNDALVFTLGTLDERPASGDTRQDREAPPRAVFGRHADHFGKGHKALLIVADSLRYDFGRLAPLDFAFIDGAHDLEHVLSDSRKVYDALRPGGCLVWHDFGAAAPWVQVREALEAFAPEETVCHVAGTAVAFLHKRGSAAAAPTAERLAVVWQGDVAVLHSLALVNRELCARLVARGHEVSVWPLTPAPTPGVPELPPHPLLAGRAGIPLSRTADVAVRHGWPPDFTPPEQGRWVVIQPWEFGSLPRAWVRPLFEQVDEVWCYTAAVRDCYLRAGVPPERVHVVPLGVDTDLFCPDSPPLPLRTQRRFRFLFVGGTIPRKGFDVLLEAYGRAFSASDDVCLVVKDMGVGTFYRGQTSEGLLDRFRQRPDAPEVEYIDRPLSPHELAGLYAACDCLALPYRGEGFGLPVAEAMASGLPVIVTGAGAAMDYCDESTGYLVPARVVQLPENRVGDWETVDRPWLLEPDGGALAGLLRRVAANPREARAKGAAGCARVRQRLTWDHAADAAERRLRELMRHPPRRLTRTDPARRSRVSLCMIVRDEEAHLPDCLRSVADLVDEIIVVDTGSTDRTKEIAAAFGAKVFDFAWVDDFAEARNESLRHATGDWVFWMDADDRLDEDNRSKLRALFARLGGENVGYVMECLCVPDAESRTATVVTHVRLFPNRPGLRWRYRVHEQILPALRGGGGEVRFTDVVVRHVGYVDAAARRRKLARDLRILRAEAESSPDDPFVLFNLASAHQELGEPAEVLRLLSRCLERSHPSDSIVRKVYAMLAQAHRNLGRAAEAVEACAAGRQHYPDDAEILFQESLARKECGDGPGARACLERLLSGGEDPHFRSIDPGLRGHKARHNLAVLLSAEGRWEQAEEQWRLALAEAPDFLPAWRGLAETLLVRGRWGEFDATADRVGSLGGAAEAEVLRERGRLAREEGRTADAGLPTP